MVATRAPVLFIDLQPNVGLNSSMRDKGGDQHFDACGHCRCGAQMNIHHDVGTEAEFDVMSRLRMN